MVNAISKRRKSVKDENDPVRKFGFNFNFFKIF